ncbi:MAG TPA: aspartate kinase, partial [Thermodesulfovibrionia bacterium]|nr:aspartate kinase [Thermodesulfovibrionia bacterium]
MAIIVQKYGGTSVGTVERINAVADSVAASVSKGNKIVLVVSAMSGETDRLIKLAHQFSPMPAEREMDLLLSSGERVSCALLAIALTERGVPCLSLTGRQSGIVTDSAHTRARIKHIESGRLNKILDKGITPIIAGFQGISEESDVTTLGRGGSDTTAVAVAAALRADVCEIYTDVDGVYTADPNIVKDARKIDKISYEEMLEMASLGAKVLHIRSVELAMKYSVPLVVLSSFNSTPGTLVTKEDNDMENVVVSGVTYDKNQTKFTIWKVPDVPGIAAKVFTPIAESGIVVDMIVQNVSADGKVTDISFTVPRTDTKKTSGILTAALQGLGASEVSVRDDITKVSVIGVGMRSHSGIAARMFEILSKAGINILMISTSEIKVSCLIEEKYTELAVRELHHAFNLSG